MKRCVVITLGLLVLPYLVIGSIVTDLMGYDHWLAPSDDVLKILENYKERNMTRLLLAAPKLLAACKAAKVQLEAEIAGGEPDFLAVANARKMLADAIAEAEEGATEIDL